MIKEAMEKARTFLFARQHAYRMLFNRESPAFETVMVDLAKFCRGNGSTFHPDPRIHAALEGRREVWLRIQNHLNLTQEELFKIFGRSIE